MPDEVSENPTAIVRRVEIAGRVLRLDLQGEIDVATSPELGEHLRKALLEGCSSIIVDMAQVTFLDSSGLRVLVQAASSLSCGYLTIANPTANVRRVIEITELGNVLRPQSA